LNTLNHGAKFRDDWPTKLDRLVGKK